VSRGRRARPQPQSHGLPSSVERTRRTAGTQQHEGSEEARSHKPAHGPAIQLATPADTHALVVLSLVKGLHSAVSSRSLSLTCRVASILHALEGLLELGIVVWRSAGSCHGVCQDDDRSHHTRSAFSSSVAGLAEVEPRARRRRRRLLSTREPAWHYLQPFLFAGAHAPNSPPVVLSAWSRFAAAATALAWSPLP